jgi:L-ribulose-5-phosphate 3-epimerase
MEGKMSRRDFVKKCGTGAVAAMAGGVTVAKTRVAGGRSESKSEIKKAFLFGMLPGDMSIEDRFKLAADVGIQGVEIGTTRDPETLKKLIAASEKTGVRIHSVMNSDHWGSPLSSPDPDVAERGMDCMRVSLKNAKDCGADTVLLVPAVVNAQVTYREAYERSQKEIRRLLPLAEKLKVIIGVENVWNKFLLSPLEFARYVDEFNSPFLRAYFDCGNVVLFGYPQDWIRTLGPRIVKLHVKGFDANKIKFVNLRDGTIDWPEVRRALKEINYSGFMTAEIGGGNREYLKDVSERMDKIIAGE